MDAVRNEVAPSFWMPIVQKLVIFWPYFILLQWKDDRSVYIGCVKDLPFDTVQCRTLPPTAFVRMLLGLSSTAKTGNLWSESLGPFHRSIISRYFFARCSFRHFIAQNLNSAYSKGTCAEWHSVRRTAWGRFFSNWLWASAYFHINSYSFGL